MAYRLKKIWKDVIEGPKHRGLTRRDFIARGLATGAMTVALPKMLGYELIQSARAGTLNCPPAVKNPGAIAQIYASGGPTMGARFIGDQQAASMNATMAANYGIVGSMQKLGPGIWIDNKSVFGVTLLQGPPGFPGGASAWQSKVLSNICGGGHLGPFNLDDGVGLNSGLVGTTSLDRSSLLNKDLIFNPVVTRAAWTNGTPAAYMDYFGVPSSAALTGAFTLYPPAATLTSPAEIQNAANGAVAIAEAFSSVFNTPTRKNGANVINSAGCQFMGNANITDPTFATGLFSAGNIGDLGNVMTVSSLTDEEATMAAAFYQSASGVVGGVMITYGGRDYHGTDPQTVITPTDIEDARAVVMFLAACYAAQQKGALIYNSNGQAIARGTQAVTGTVNGASMPMNAPVAAGDAGGVYNAGLMIFYSPTGSLPTARYSGTLLSSSGDVRMDPSIGSYQNAMAGLYMTAHKFVGGSIPASLLTRLQGMNLALAPDILTLI